METLHNILETLDNAIDEVQSWSIIVSILSSEKTNDVYECEYCSDYNGKLLSQISSNFHFKDKIPWHITPSLDSVSVCKRGHAFIKPDDDYSFSGDIKIFQKYEWLSKFGNTIYHSLDRGLEDGEERILLPTTTKVIELMLFSEEDDDDEGIETSDVSQVVSNIVDICSQEMSSDVTVFSTATSVLKALYAQTIELRTFLKRIEPPKEPLHELQELEILGRREWARLWMQVMHDMREKAAYHIARSRQINWNRIGFKEFELTPFEIVMVEVKNKLYNLRKVEFNPELRKNARDEILEFIRSRPPLKSVPDRKPLLSPINVESPRDKLLNDIRSKNYNLKNLKDSCDESNLQCSTAKQKVLPIKRKLLKPHIEMFDFSSPVTHDSEKPAFEFPDKSSRSKSMGTLDSTSCSSVSLQYSPTLLERRHSVEDDISSPIATQQNCATHFSPDLSKLQNRRPYSCIEVSYSVPTKKKLVTFDRPDNNCVNDSSSSDETDSVHLRPNSPNKRNLSRRCSINLNLSELSHIRKVLTNADMENARGHDNKDLYDQLANEKICFVCRKSRFNVLERLFTKKRCEICLKAICTNCLLEICVDPDFTNFPVEILSPNSSIKRCISSGNIHSSRGADYETKKTCKHCALLINDVKRPATK